MRYKTEVKPYEGEEVKRKDGEPYEEWERRKNVDISERTRHALQHSVVTFYDTDWDDDDNEIDGDQIASVTYEELLEKFWQEYWDDNDLDPDSRPMDMSGLNDYASSLDEPADILFRAFYGHDYNPWNEKEEFNPNQEWFAFNGYGNLVSIDDFRLGWYLSDYIGFEELVKWVAENKDETDLD